MEYNFLKEVNLWISRMYPLKKRTTSPSQGTVVPH